MDELIAFLLARLQERQAHAEKDMWALDRATGGGDWMPRYGYNLGESTIGEPGDGGRIVAVFIARSGRPLPVGADDQHQKDVFLTARLVRTARKRANQALADVTAQRKLIEYIVDERHLCPHPADPDWKVIEAGQEKRLTYPCGCLRALAAAHADHPDYRQVWRPS